MSMDNIDNNDALSHLDKLDAEHGINKPIPQEVKEEPQLEVSNQVTSLGKARSYQELQTSSVSESPWKSLNLELLPSGGMFYTDNVELLLKSAKTKEIRHWSTIDELDPVDVREKIGFILSSCTKFKVKGDPRLFNFKDYLEVDRYHILFRIHELTFPNQENKLMANIKCDNLKCRRVNKIHVTSQNLLGYGIPEELVKYYSPAEKCFVIHSEKIGETLRFYLPTTGIQDLFRQKKQMELSAGQEIDKAFYNFGPYLLNDWRNKSIRDVSNLKMESNGWSQNKFAIIYNVTEQLRKASINRATGVCENCKQRLESSIFLGGSFTVKDIFIISARLDELI